MSGKTIIEAFGDSLTAAGYDNSDDVVQSAVTL